MIDFLCQSKEEYLGMKHCKEKIKLNILRALKRINKEFNIYLPVSSHFRFADLLEDYSLSLLNDKITFSPAGCNETVTKYFVFSVGIEKKKIFK